ncbi:hypothetical protein Tco_0690978 [Tanacetum coccineum]
MPPCFTKLIITDLMEKYKSIPKRLEKDYHIIKDDTPLVSVYTTGELTVRGMLTSDDLLTDAIRDTQAYKDYVEKFERVDVPMIQPKPVESTQGTHMTPRDTKTPNPANIRIKQQKPTSTTPLPPGDDQERDDIIKLTQLSLALDKTTKVYEEQQNVVAVEQNILEEDVEKIVEEPGSHKENPKKNDDGDEKKDDKKDDDDDNDDDHDDHALIRTRGIKEKVDEAIKDIVPKLSTTATSDLINDNLSRIVANVFKKEKESSQAGVPALISQEFVTHAPKIIEELFRIHMQNTVINVHPTTSTSNEPTFDLKQQLYLKMKSDLQAQVTDLELWDILKVKFEKSSASVRSCRDDAFRKHGHNEHQGDDAPPKGEKNAKRQKTSKSLKSARVIDEDEGALRG